LGRLGLIALIVTALTAVAGCGGEKIVNASEMSPALQSAISRLEHAGYEVRPELVGLYDVPVLVVNPDADGAAWIFDRSDGNWGRIPLSIDGVPANKSESGTASLSEHLCGRFIAGAPDVNDARAALRDSGLCSDARKGNSG
jgi:hypothetical protein